jgi:predicted DNA-binding transcriptional regulator AlpA
MSETTTASNRYLSIPRVCDKLSRKKTWVYDRVKNDPTFPRPLKLGAWQVFIESQIDEWVMLQAQQRQAA